MSQSGSHGMSCQGVVTVAVAHFNFNFQKRIAGHGFVIKQLIFDRSYERSLSILEATSCYF